MKIWPSANLVNLIETLDENSKTLIEEKPIAKTQEKNNLYKSFKKVFILAQVFGYLPVQGISGSDHGSLHFKWRSVRVFYSFVTITGALFFTCTQLHKIITKGMDLLEIDRLCFNFFGFLSGILFLVFAKNWPNLMKDWIRVENSMARYGWPKNLNRILNILLIVFMLLAFTEHSLNQVNKLLLSFECNGSASEALNYYLGDMTYSHYFTIIEYNAFFGVLLQLIHMQLTFMWTYIDIFIMVISIALSHRLGQITERIRSTAEARIGADSIWKNLRQDYNRLCKLCKRVDDHISFIVLLAFTGDLFFILMQLFNSLRKRTIVVERVYFYFSFGLLIIRTICLCLFGAKVNDESRKPLIILNSVPSKVYNLEIQRFIQQIGTTEVAITGRNFFSITRGLILSIAGAIVTYELVLIQFNDNLLKNKDRSPETSKGCPMYV